jgi:hypothetical protein
MNNTTALALSNKGNGSRAHARARRLARWQAVFLKTLRRNPNVTAASRAARVNRVTAYRAREDEAFAAKWDECLDASVDEVEEKAFKIAKDGDNQMIQFVLKAFRPDRYRETARLEVDQRLVGVLIVPEKEQKDP